jgi:hypothetical protein
MRIITGCYRSGTSFVAQAVHHLGGDFGDQAALIAGDRWNRRGYFENRDVNILNHRLMFGDWSDPELWVDVMWPDNAWIRFRKIATILCGPLYCQPSQIERRGRKLQNEIIALADSLQGKVVKDPRFSYVMQPWTAARVSAVLYVFRHPWEAARSMSRQTTLPLSAAYYGWRDAVQKFWRAPPRVPIYVVDYNAFFDPNHRVAALQTLAAFVGCECDETRAGRTLGEILDRKLRSSVAESPNLSAKIDRCYRFLLDQKDAAVSDSRNAYPR